MLVQVLCGAISSFNNLGFSNLRQIHLRNVRNRKLKRSYKPLQKHVNAAAFAAVGMSETSRISKYNKTDWRPRNEMCLGGNCNQIVAFRARKHFLRVPRFLPGRRMSSEPVVPKSIYRWNSFRLWSTSLKPIAAFGKRSCLSSTAFLCGTAAF